MNSQKTPAKPMSFTKPMQVETAEVEQRGGRAQRRRGW